MTIKEVQGTVDDWIKTNGVRYFSELTNMSLLTEEVGELSRHIARVYGEQSYKIPTSDTDAKVMIGEEISDVLFVLICLANQMDIDLETVITASLEKKTKRDKDRHKNNPKLRE